MSGGGASDLVGPQRREKMYTKSPAQDPGPGSYSGADTHGDAPLVPSPHSLPLS